MEAWWWTLSIRVFLVAGVLLRYLGVLRVLIMRVPSTAGVRGRWGSRVGPCRGASSYYGPITSLHAQAAMLMTPRAVHSLPLCSVSFRSYYSTLSFSFFLFRHSYFSFFLFLFVFSLSQREPHGIAPPLFFLPAGFVFVVETGGHDTARRRRLTSLRDFARPRTRFWPPSVRNVHAAR